MKTKQLTDTELARYFADYRAAFPDWDVEYDTVLVRQRWPVKQHIAFEPLLRGAYRPSHSAEILIALQVRILPAFLDMKHREVLPREHSRKVPLVVKAMEEQFRPSVRKPLDVPEVLRLGEEHAASLPFVPAPYATGLAALNAHLDNPLRAAFWCDRVEDRVQAQGRPPAEWELRLVAYVHQLRRAIESGTTASFFRSIATAT
jgi:hypothetical protein